MLEIILLLIALAALYYSISASSDYFDVRGVKCFKTPPILGTLYIMLFNKKHFVEWFVDMYKMFPDQKLIGYFELTTPVYMLRDIELIKQITVKDFDHFLNHRLTIDENIDKLFGRSLFMMKDQKWKDMRSTLSPALNALKMKKMFTLIVEIADNNSKYLKEQVTNSVIDVELYDLLSRFANDVIAKCAFAVSINSFKDRNNEFYKTASKFLIFNKSSGFKFFLFSAAPKLMKVLKVTLFDPKLGLFFKDLLFNSIEYREENNIEIHDIINLLMQVQKVGKINVEEDAKDKNTGFATVEESEALQKKVKRIKKFDEDDLIAQSMVFFLAGFDTVATGMCFIAYLLALNPDCQDRLISEIDDLLQDLDGKLPTYENIQNMEYLDMVVSESLRLYTPGAVIDRQCNKQYVMHDSDGNPVVLNPGDAVIIPTDAIHKDEKYFPNPMKFDPERFSKENRHKIQSFSYNTFGIGPRKCIGSRFALMECKAIIFSLLANFCIEKNNLTVDPIKLDPNPVSLRIKGGFNVRFRSRNKN